MEREFYDPLSVAADGGVVAAEPDDAWSQASATASWRRDLTPCGGLLHFEVTLAP